jgi:hypothetical protein
MGRTPYPALERASTPEGFADFGADLVTTANRNRAGRGSASCRSAKLVLTPPPASSSASSSASARLRATVAFVRRPRSTRSERSRLALDRPASAAAACRSSSPSRSESVIRCPITSSVTTCVNSMPERACFELCWRRWRGSIRNEAAAGGQKRKLSQSETLALCHIELPFGRLRVHRQSVNESGATPTPTPAPSARTRA